MSLALVGVAFVTGAGGGIGRACVEQFVRDGCTRLLITDLKDDYLAETVQSVKGINPEAIVISKSGDITDNETIDNLIKLTVTKFGRLDYAVNSAGIIGKQKEITQLSLDDYDFVESVNARAIWLCERAQIAQMLTQEPLPTHDGRTGNKGAIVNISSMCGLIGLPNSTPYTMSKHAVIGLVRSDSTTFARQGIRVNALCPGIIDTGLISPQVRDFTMEYCKKFTPMERLGTPQEVADVASFLVSSRATYISGAAILVDGGHTGQ